MATRRRYLKSFKLGEAGYYGRDGKPAWWLVDKWGRRDRVLVRVMNTTPDGSLAYVKTGNGQRLDVETEYLREVEDQP